MNRPLLELRHLAVDLPTPRGTVHAVRDVSLSLAAGEMLAVVGESGCGKSVTAQAILGLLPQQAQVNSELASFDGAPLFTTPGLCGQSIAMIFQNPMGTFNPTLSIGYQIAEPLRVHHGLNRADAEREAVQLLERMQISRARERAAQYPHAFSGGMLQRAAIAMALAARPRLLVADEPTTALDVSTQADVMALLAELREERALALLFITHDLGLVAHHADRVSVMYAGEVVESADTGVLLQSPCHPYTRALLGSLPRLHSRTRLDSIAGAPPDLRQPPAGCAFAPRCPQALSRCTTAVPPVVATAQQARCWLPALDAIGEPLP